MNSGNPYAAPESAAADEPDHSLTELVRGWEKLRLAYNGVLLIPGLVVLGLWVSRQNMHGAVALASGLTMALAANTAFFLGPVAELYIRGLFLRGRPLGRGRYFLFCAGLFVSAVVFLCFAMITML